MGQLQAMPFLRERRVPVDLWGISRLLADARGRRGGGAALVRLHHAGRAMSRYPLKK